MYVMKKQIYFLFSTPPLVSYEKRYCIEYFNKQNWETHVVDLSPIINPIAFREVRFDLIDNTKREILYRKKEFKQLTKKAAKNAVFVLTQDFNYDSFFIHCSIKREQKYGYISRIDTNVEPDKPKSSKRIKRVWGSFNYKRILNSVFIRIPRKMFFIKAADFFVLGGLANQEEYLKLGYIDDHTVIRHIHSLDYEKYLEIRDEKSKNINEPYCVFLDQYLPYHPDNLSGGYIIDGDEYYDQLEKFFDKIEQKYNLKVIIAEHPRSSYENKNDILKKFKRIKFKTAELVKDAEFVMGHFSTSISYAVLFKKPLFLLTTDSINKISLFCNVMNKYSQLLEAKIINISKINQALLTIEKREISVNRYKEFIHLYLKEKKGEDKWFKEQFFELIKEIS